MRKSLRWCTICIVFVLLVNLGGYSLGAEQVLYVNNTKVNVRSSPTTAGSNIVATVAKGTAVVVLQQQGAWYQVQLPDGRQGWISRWVLISRETPLTDSQSRRLTPDDTQKAPPGPETTDTMIYIPGGTYIVGSNEAEIQAIGRQWNIKREMLVDELEKERVAVSGFYIDQYEVTNAEYKKFVKETRYPPPLHWNNGIYPLGTENHPVTYVSWDDAQAYAQWAGKRLPTAEEWEVAARGGNGQIFPWGNTDVGQQVNINNSQEGTVPVGTSLKDRSEFEVYDLGGNVTEWTMTQYQGEKDVFIAKGGAWNSLPFEARGANQTPAQAEYRLPHLGFRCVGPAPRE